MTETDVKRDVRRFYESVGWQQIGDGLYQNARYEDLRPVSQGYLHHCHLRVGRHLSPEGECLLDAGSGPIQYPEYLSYSSGYRYRVCLDISRRALREARERIGGHGLYVVGDVANLPFKSAAFEGVVSLHTVHHLPADEHERAFRDFHRVLRRGGKAVTVYSWGSRSPLMRLFRLPIRGAFWLIKLYRRIIGEAEEPGPPVEAPEPGAQALLSSSGTFTFKHDYGWMRDHLADLPGFDIRVWRSVSAQFLRAFIHGPLFGAFWLRILYAVEELFPRLLGRFGQYPMILFEKPATAGRRLERSN